MDDINTETKTQAQSSYPDRYYAQYDPHATQPAPVTGWYDMWIYSSLDGLPPLSELLPLTADFWEQHISQPQTSRAVDNGKIVEYIPAPTLQGQQAKLNSITFQKQAAGVYFQPAGTATPVLFPSDDAAYGDTLQGAQTVALEAWTDGTQWTLADGSTVPMAASDVTALFRKMAAYRAACQNRAAALGKALKTDLNTDLTAGWPDNN